MRKFFRLLFSYLKALLFHLFEAGFVLFHRCSVDAKGKALWRGVTCEIPVCSDGCAFGNCSR